MSAQENVTTLVHALHQLSVGDEDGPSPDAVAAVATAVSELAGGSGLTPDPYHEGLYLPGGAG